MGLLLSAARGEEPPPPGAPFVICTDDLRVSAVSAAAEALVGEEAEALGTPLLELVAGGEIARVSECGPPAGALVLLQKPLQDLRKVVTPVRKP